MFGDISMYPIWMNVVFTFKYSLFATHVYAPLTGCTYDDTL